MQTKLTDEDRAGALAPLQEMGWSLVDDRDAICKEFVFADFNQVVLALCFLIVDRLFTVRETSSEVSHFHIFWIQRGLMSGMSLSSFSTKHCDQSKQTLFFFVNFSPCHAFRLGVSCQGWR